MNEETSGQSVVTISNKFDLPKSVKFNGKNWDDFSYMFENMLDEHDLWDSAIKRPKSNTKAYVIIKNVDDSLLNIIRQTQPSTNGSNPSCADIYSHLQAQYQRTDAATKALALAACVKHNISTDMDEALKTHSQLKRELISAFGDSIKSSDLADMLFIAHLPAVYHPEVAVIKASKEWTFASLEESLKLRWLELKQSKEANFTTGGERDRKRSKPKNSTAHDWKSKNSTGTAKYSCDVHDWNSNSKPCFVCANPERCAICKQHNKKFTFHEAYSDRCPFIKEPTIEQKVTHANVATTFGLMDSGCNDPMVSNKEFLHFYCDDPQPINIADGNSILAPGTGTLKMINHKGNGLAFADTLYCPALAKNLFSVSRFDEKGYATVFVKGKSYVVPSSCVVVTQLEEESVLTGTLINGLYQVPMKKLELSAHKTHCFLSIQAKRDADRWHTALNHIGRKRMLQLSSLVDGCTLISSNLNSCDACFIGKSKMKSYPPSTTVLSELGEVVSSDTWGPVNIPDLNGNRYYIVFTDHLSKKTWLFLYSSKDQVKQIVVRFLTFLETQLGHPIKTFRFDQEGGYKSAIVTDYCTSRGILLQPTNTGAHQENGQNETYHRHCLDAVRTVLHQSGLPLSLWGEAAQYYNYTRNLLPSTVGTIPEEIWTGKRQNIAHLRSFGEPCFPHVIPQHRKSALSPRSTTAIFVGYDLNSKSYRCYDSVSNSVFLSRSVDFDPDFRFPKLSVTRFDDDFTANFDNIDLSGAYQDENDSIGDNLDEELIPSVTTPTHASTIVDSPELSPLSDSVTMAISLPDSAPLSDSVTIPNDEVTPSVSIPGSFPAEPTLHYERSLISPANILGDIHNRTTRSRQSHHALCFLASTKFPDPPKHYTDIAGRIDADDWYDAVQREIDGLFGHKFAEVIPYPYGVDVIPSRFVFVRKSTGVAKARLVARGDRQKVDTAENLYAPVADDGTLKLLLTKIAHEDLECDVVDINQAFLLAPHNGDLHISLPTGFHLPNQSGRVALKLKKCLYGLKESPKRWYQTLSTYLRGIGFQSCPVDPCFFKRGTGADISYLLFHVDDILIAARNVSTVAAIKKGLHQTFGIKDLGPIQKFLHYSVTRNRSKNTITVDQKEYTASLLNSVNYLQVPGSKTKGKLFLKPMLFDEAEDVIRKDDYQTLLGSLQHLSCHTRFDVAHEVSTLSRFLHCPRRVHWQALAQLLRYLNHTWKYSLTLGGSDPLALHVYVDATYDKCVTTGRGTLGYFILFGSSVISAHSSWYRHVCTSSTESEFCALYKSTSRTLWFSSVLHWLGVHLTPTIYSDNEGAIKFAHSLQATGRLQHIRPQFHFVREQIHEGTILLKFVRGIDNCADLLTKSCRGNALMRFLAFLGMGIGA
jgi:hypothetical protein